jgi:hypothetical protein
MELSSSPEKPVRRMISLQDIEVPESGWIEI